MGSVRARTDDELAARKAEILKSAKKQLMSMDYDDITLAEALKSRLLRYMIPNVTNKLDSLPLLKSGKVDRVRLRDMIGGN